MLKIIESYPNTCPNIFRSGFQEPKNVRMRQKMSGSAKKMSGSAKKCQEPAKKGPDPQYVFDVNLCGILSTESDLDYPEEYVWVQVIILTLQLEKC